MINRKTLDRALDCVIAICADISDAAYAAKSVHVWYSADGRVTPITEMDDQWLRNAIGCVERGKANGKKYARVLPFMRAELADRETRRRMNVFPKAEPGAFGRAMARGTLGTLEDRVGGLEARERAREGRLSRLEPIVLGRGAVITEIIDKASKLTARVEETEKRIRDWPKHADTHIRRVMHRVFRRVRFNMSDGSPGMLSWSGHADRWRLVRRGR